MRHQSCSGRVVDFRTRRRAPLADVALGAALILIAGCESAPAPAVAHHVAIRAMRFEPAVLHVAVGDTVRWTNLDLVPHTVTSQAGAFDSGNLPPDSSWAVVVAHVVFPITRVSTTPA